MANLFSRHDQEFEESDVYIEKIKQLELNYALLVSQAHELEDQNKQLKRQLNDVHGLIFQLGASISSDIPIMNSNLPIREQIKNIIANVNERYRTVYDMVFEFDEFSKKLIERDKEHSAVVDGLHAQIKVLTDDKNYLSDKFSLLQENLSETEKLYVELQQKMESKEETKQLAILQKKIEQSVEVNEKQGNYIRKLQEEIDNQNKTIASLVQERDRLEKNQEKKVTLLPTVNALHEETAEKLPITQNNATKEGNDLEKVQDETETKQILSVNPLETEERISPILLRDDLHEEQILESYDDDLIDESFGESVPVKEEKSVNHSEESISLSQNESQTPPIHHESKAHEVIKKPISNPKNPETKKNDDRVSHKTTPMKNNFVSEHQKDNNSKQKIRTTSAKFGTGKYGNVAWVNLNKKNLYLDIHNEITMNVDKLKPVMWYVIHVMGTTGCATRDDIYLMISKYHKISVSSSEFSNFMPILESLGVLETYSIPSALSANYFIHQLTSKGLKWFTYLFDDKLVPSELVLIKKDHDNLEHGYFIKETRQILIDLGYNKVTMNRSENTFQIGERSWIPDLVAFSKANKKIFVEVERGHHKQVDFDDKINRASCITKELYFVVPDNEAKKIIQDQISRWYFSAKHKGEDADRILFYVVTLRTLNTLKNFGNAFIPSPPTERG